MATNTNQVVAAPTERVPAVLTRAWYFVRHFVEMCLAMCIGGIPLIGLFFWGAGRLGFADLVTRSPEFTILVIGIILAVPMTAWMRFRKHNWQSTLEMASSSIILAILLIAGSSLGILERSTLISWMTRFACPAMLVPMFFRLDHYTASHANHQHHAQAADAEVDPHAHHHHAS